MIFTAPTTKKQYVKEPLAPGQRCLVCFETDPTKYNACDSPDCYPVGPFAEPPERLVFTMPTTMVSAFELASRMRAKALRLGWDADDERNALLRRARALELGDAAEVPEEPF